MIEFIFEIILDIVLMIVFDLIFYPLLMIICTPYILIASLIRKGTWSDLVKDYYHRLHRYWWRGWKRHTTIKQP